MKAFIVDRYGSADRVRASEVPDPEMREDLVFVDGDEAEIYTETNESHVEGARECEQLEFLGTRW